MKNLKLLKLFCFISLIIFTFCLSIFFAKPVDAIQAQNQRLIAMGIIDEVVTPEQLGLDYLQEEQLQIADGSLIDSIYEAEEEVSTLPEEIALDFPTGTNDPIFIGQLPGDRGTSLEGGGLISEGFVDGNGRAQDFNSDKLADMFEVEANNGGDIAMTPDAQEILVADASGSFLQARRIPVIDLIVRNPRNGRRYLVRRVNANAVCRDALNAVFNRTLRAI